MSEFIGLIVPERDPRDSLGIDTNVYNKVLSCRVVILREPSFSLYDVIITGGQATPSCYLKFKNIIKLLRC